MTTLDEIEARAAAATGGPWHIQKDCEEDYEAGIVYSEWPQTLVGPEQSYPSEWAKERGDTRNIDEINELTFPDAEFIAHAREDVPKLVAALRAVEALHRPSADHGDGNYPYCVGCYEAGGLDGAPLHPCPTITAIREALA